MQGFNREAELLSPFLDIVDQTISINVYSSGDPHLATLWGISGFGVGSGWVGSMGHDLRERISFIGNITNETEPAAEAHDRRDWQLSIPWRVLVLSGFGSCSV